MDKGFLDVPWTPGIGAVIMLTGVYTSTFCMKFLVYLTAIRFVDRDMLMRFHWGLAVGHAYTHGCSLSDPSVIWASNSDLPGEHDDSEHGLSTNSPPRAESDEPRAQAGTSGGNTDSMSSGHGNDFEHEPSTNDTLHPEYDKPDSSTGAENDGDSACEGSSGTGSVNEEGLDIGEDEDQWGDESDSEEDLLRHEMYDGVGSDGDDDY